MGFDLFSFLGGEGKPAGPPAPSFNPTPPPKTTFQPPKPVARPVMVQPRSVAPPIVKPPTAQPKVDINQIIKPQKPVLQVAKTSKPAPSIMHTLKGVATSTINQVKNPIDVLNSLRQGIGGLADISVAAMTHNKIADQNAINKTMKAQDYSLNASRGLLTPNEAQNADLYGNAKQRSDFIHPVVRGVATYAPYFIGGSAAKDAEAALAARGASPVVKELGRRAASAALQGGTSFVSNLGLNKLDTGKYNVKGAAESAVAPAVLGGAFPGKSLASKKAADAKANTVNTDKFLNGEHDNGVKPTEFSQPKVKSTRSSVPMGTVLNGIKSKISQKVGDTKTKANFYSNLEQNLRTLHGAYQSTNLRLRTLAKQSLADKNNSEALYHSFEDPSIQLTPGEQALKEQTQKMQAATQDVKAIGTGKDAKEVTQGYIHRIALGKGAKVEQMINGERQNPAEGIMRGTTDGSKRPVNQVLVDNQGNKIPVSIKGGRVTKWTEDGTKGEDLGPLKKNLPSQIKESFDPAIRSAIHDTVKNIGAKIEKVVKIRGNAAGTFSPLENKIRTNAATPETVAIHELGHAADQKFGLIKQFFGGSRPKSDMILQRQIDSLKNTMSKLNPKISEGANLIKDYKGMIADHQNQLKMNAEHRNLADLRLSEGSKPSMGKYVRQSDEKIANMFYAYIHAPDLFKKTAPTVYKKFDSFIKTTPEMQPIRDMKPSLKLTSSLVGDKQLKGEFIDKSGKHWQITRGTTKDIEGATNTKYLHNAVLNTGVEHANAVDAANINAFKEQLLKSPDWKDHAIEVKGSESLPKGYTIPKSPAFRGWAVDRQTRNLIDRYLGPKVHNTSIGGRMYQSANSAAVQAIIMNPAIHGGNLMAQSFSQIGNIPISKLPVLNKIPAGPFAVIRVGQAAKDLANPEAREAALHDYLQAGGHIPSYGKDYIGKSVVAQSAAKVGSKVNARAMNSIDANARITTFMANVKGGMKPEEAVRQIDTFLGKPDNSGKVAQNFGMFYHWLKTEAGALKEQGLHPVKNAGSITNTAIVGLAFTYGLNAVLRQITGNPNAKVTQRGELGLANDVYKVGTDIYHRDPNAAISDTLNVVGAHTAPVVAAGVEQAIPSIEKYSSLSPRNAPMPTNSERIKQLETNLFAPSANINNVNNGKMSFPQALLTQYGGAQLPHVAGAPAVPKDLSSPFNTGGAKPVAGKDPTGYKQEQTYYKSYQSALDSLKTNPDALNAFTLNFGSSKNPDTGGYNVTPSGMLTVSKAAALLAQPAALEAANKFMQAQAKAGNSVDPFYTKLTPDQQKAVLSYRVNKNSVNDTSQASQWLTNNNSWYQPFAKEQEAYYNSLPKGDPNKPTNPVEYPVAPKEVASAQSTYDTLPQSNSALRSQFLNNHPELINYWSDLANYENQMRQQGGYIPLKTAPQATPAIQSYINKYDAASKADRKTMRNSDPTAYQSMIAYYDSTDLSTIAKESGINNLQGNPDTSQKELKAISSLASDIYQNPSGSYSIVPAGWMDGLTNSSSSSSYKPYSSSSSSSSPVQATAPSSSPIDKLISEMKASSRISNPKSVSIKKGFGGKNNYHIKKVSMGKQEKLTKLSKPLRPKSVYKNGFIKF